jgi:hypothetical protein
MALEEFILDITIIAEVKDILFTSMKRLRIVFHYFFLLIIVQIGEGYNLTIEELVQNLHMDALKFMSS